MTLDRGRRIRVSKFLSKVLRHDPRSIGIELEPGGWVRIDKLLPALAEHGTDLTRDELMEVVEGGDKPRFEVSGGTGDRVRARYGHSLEVELGYRASDPPDVLYHGTAERAVPAIEEQGVSSMRRQLVHLSRDVETARQVGGRHGPPVVLEIDARAMAEAGHVFHELPGGTWLTAEVPPAFIRGQVP